MLITHRLWLITVVFSGVTTGGLSVMLSLVSSTDVTSGQEVCPQIIEFSCAGIEVSFLEWQRNGIEIEPNFHIGNSAPSEQTNGLYTVILEAIDVDQTRRVANMTTRLVINISSLMSGDEIVCATLGMNSSTMLNYTLRGPPPAPALYTHVLISLQEENATFNAFDISWNPSIAAAYAITSYIVTPLTTTEGEDLTINCPSSCSPVIPCPCTGLAVGERVTVNISAVNCDTQEGAAVAVTIASSCVPDNLGTLDSKTDLRCVSSFGGSVSIPNGVGCYNTTVGSVATYMCDEGYTVVHRGGLKRTCLINGSWNGSTPECKGVSHLPTILIAVVSFVAIIIISAIIIIIIIIFVFVCWKRKGTVTKQVTNTDINDNESDNQFEFRENVQS